MKRWFSRLIRRPDIPWRRLIGLPPRGLRAVKPCFSWLREPFPDVSWGYLLRFIRLPLLWLLAVFTVYAIGWLTFIDPNNRWSAAEVFLGIAGGGAALAALAGLAKQFETPRPELALEHSFDWETEGWTLTLINKGSEARRVEAVVEAVRNVDAGPGPAGSFGRHWQAGNWTRDWESGWDAQDAHMPWTCAASFTDELKAGDRVELGTFEFVKRGLVRVTCSNGEGVTWRQPSSGP